jgi:hypothetical protein
VFDIATSLQHELTRGRIKPINYNLSLSNLEFGGKWGYDGLIKIESQVKTSTDEVVVNVKELEIVAADVYGKDGGRESVEYTLKARLTYLQQQLHPSKTPPTTRQMNE